MREGSVIMRGRFIIVFGLALACPSLALGVDPAPGASATERNEPVAPGIPPTTGIIVEKPKPAEKPKLVELPKPVEKPRPVVTKDVRTAVVEPGKPKEPASPAAAPAAEPGETAMATQEKKSAGYSFSCLALAFAMLLIGIAAGFLWRHLMSRRKLGGMTVRIGTWRGIP